MPWSGGCAVFRDFGLFAIVRTLDPVRLLRGAVFKRFFFPRHISQGPVYMSWCRHLTTEDTGPVTGLNSSKSCDSILSSQRCGAGSPKPFFWILRDPLPPGVWKESCTGPHHQSAPSSDSLAVTLAVVPVVLMPFAILSGFVVQGGPPLPPTLNRIGSLSDIAIFSTLRLAILIICVIVRGRL